MREQLKRYLKRFGIDPNVSCGTDSIPIRKCIVSGFFKNAAKMLPDGSYTSVREGVVSLFFLFLGR